MTTFHIDPFRIDHHHYIHNELDERATQKLDQLLAQGVKIMASNDKVESALADLDTKLSDLSDTVSAVVATDATEDAAFQAEIDRLKAIIASGDTVSQENLDALAAQISTRSGRLAPVTEALAALKVPAGTPAEPTA